MSASGSKSLATIGFLTVREYADRGLFGGYLVLNAAGRPLEFHCTAPVRPSRAQEILYGPTLQPFLYGEQIGGTLVQKAVSKPLFVCTDAKPVLTLRDMGKPPVVLVLDQAEAVTEEAGSGTSRRPDSSHDSLAPSGLVGFTLGANRVALPQAYAEDRDTISSAWQEQFDNLNLYEPFTRIHDAIEETQRGSTRAA
jgi:hypothetical protein